MIYLFNVTPNMVCDKCKIRAPKLGMLLNPRDELRRFCMECLESIVRRDDELIRLEQIDKRKYIMSVASVLSGCREDAIC